MLYTPNMIVGWMKKYIIYEKIGEIYPECSEGIELLNDFHTKLNSNILYIGTSDEIYKAITQKATYNQKLFLLSSGCNDELKSSNLSSNITLLCFNLDIVTLYNKIHYYVHHFLQWDYALEKAMYSNNSLQALLDEANKLLKTSMAILNMGYRVLAENRNPKINEPILDSVCEAGMMNYDYVKTIYDDLANAGLNLQYTNEVEYVASHSGLYSFIWNITYDSKNVARFIMILNQAKPSPFYRDFGRVIVGHITDYFLNGHSINYGQNEIFGSLVADLIEGRINNDTTLAERLKPVQLAFTSYYHLLIVNFQDATVSSTTNPGNKYTHLPWNYIISQFEQLFPFSNITTYKNELLILHRKNNYSPQLQLKNESAVINLLEKYNGYLMLGNFSKFINSLASIYYQTQDAFKLARAMNKNNKRIFYYEDYSMYQTIEMAITGMLTKNGLANPIYLCPPALVSLYKYDKKQNTNLCHILRTYLNCDRNAAETSRQLFMHRNTMLYNITKIENILGQSLNDTTLKARLQFGFYVIDYVENYMNDELTNLKPNLIPDNNTK